LVNTDQRRSIAMRQNKTKKLGKVNGNTLIAAVYGNGKEDHFDGVAET
jgi:hypothetical protein